MKKIDIVNKLLPERRLFIPKVHKVSEYASASLALCKYWGKKNEELHIPTTNSVSIPLTGKGATSAILCNAELKTTIIKINELNINEDEKWGKKLLKFIKLFLPKNNLNLEINITLNLEVAAGLASSSCIYGSLIKAFNKLYDWQISNQDLSVLARIGSGSAARAVFENHFIEHFAGNLDNGMDSYSSIIYHHPNLQDLKVALIVVNQDKKYISSSDAMQITIYSPFYQSWAQQTAKDIMQAREHIIQGNFVQLAQIAENNSLLLHSLMLSARPAILYSEPETLKIIKTIWEIRNKFQVPIFFTQDAGANIKILYRSLNEPFITKYFKMAEKIKIFD